MKSLLVVQAAQTVPVTVLIKKQVEFGETMKLVGNQSFLGDWDVNNGPSLKWTEGHVWETKLDVPIGVDINFKAVRVKEDGSARWENGSDRKFKALGPDYALSVTCKWDDTNNTRVKAMPLNGAPEVADDHQHDEQNGNNGNGSFSGEWKKSGIATTSLSSIEEDARSTSAWVGKGPEFVRSRLDQGQYTGVWRTEGLQGLELDLVQGDQKASNWLGKLGLMKGLLVDRPQMMRPHMDELVACYVYATWINTGAIRCVETGGHHRPNHHANAALQMFRSLEWAIGDAALGDGGMHWPAEARMLAARRLHTRLPSISGEFRVSTPLTRIRDIAHRNDIPKDLKDEIKHTLQNKLHRSAGPEDLVATEQMLKRITARQGEYPGDFIKEFQIFARELREFFNASGLQELLDQTYGSMDDRHKGVVNQFREAMARLDGQQDPALDDLMAALFMGTQTRGYFVSGLSAGLRNDVSDDVLAMRQRWRLAEIRIEDYLFVLLARTMGLLEQAGGAGMLARPNSTNAWRMAAGAMVQGLRQLGLSGFATKELLVLENEVESWLAAFTSGGVQAQRENALRGKACAERVQRLASQYSDLVMSVYQEPSKRLGWALGVPEHMARIFGESEVRASVAFQVSRLAGLLSKALRGVANMDAWDGLVTGEGVGRLIAVDSISPETMEAACQGHDDNVVLLVHRADGDEEVGALGGRLQGVVLCQELPHLSHLGVRARQEKVTFATCDDEEYVRNTITPLINRTVKLTVSPDGVTLKEVAGGGNGNGAKNGTKAANGNGKSHEAAARAGKAGAASIATTVKAKQLDLVPLEKATVETCGSKAAKCGELQRLASGAGKSLFVTPPGTVLPFGCMELALADSGCLREFQACLSELDRNDLTGSALADEVERMATVINKIQLPDSLLDKIASTFSNNALLAVRSTANVEDLAGMSAAGLYESKVGIPVDSRDALNTAICEVWASLYSRRAVLSRRSAGVGQSSASMAVLIMELVAPEVSFVLHTARPSDSNTNIILAELAPGQGETLASGTRGTPWRLEIDKSTSKVDTLAFANFSRALVVPGSGTSSSGTGGQFLKYASFDEVHARQKGGVALATRSGLVEVEVDYSKQKLSTDNEYREQVARQLARVGMLIESSFGREAQDIEGGLVPVSPGTQINIVVFQTRPQL